MNINPLNYSISEINTLVPEKGRILISEPFMPDPYFKRSVVLLLEHNEKGSFGFILNKSIEFKLNQTLIDFPEFDTKVYMGGPVQPDHLFFIHTLGDKIDETVQISDGLFWGGDFESLKHQIAIGELRADQVRFFLGYSGWDSDQLSHELDEESWIISDINAPEILQTNPTELWRECLIKMGENCSQIANFPEDPTFN